MQRNVFVLTVFVENKTRVQEIQILSAFRSDQCAQNPKKNISYIHTVSWNGNVLVGKSPPGTQAMNVILPRILMQ